MEEAIESLVKQMLVFLASDKRNTYISFHNSEYDCEIYLRKGHHIVNGEVSFFLDLPNLNVEPQGTGLFSAFLARVESVVKRENFAGVFVENIFNEHLLRYLKRNGYKWDGRNEIGPSLYKLRNDL